MTQSKIFKILIGHFNEPGRLLFLEQSINTCTLSLDLKKNNNS